MCNRLPFHLHRIVQFAVDHRPDDVRTELDNLGAESSADLSRLLSGLTSHGYCHLAEFLVGKGANPNFQEESGATPISDVIMSNLRKEEKIVALTELLRLGADPNVYGCGSNPVVWLAARNNLRELVKLLLRHGADPKARTIDPDGGSSLEDLAADRGYDWLSILLKPTA